MKAREDLTFMRIWSGPMDSPAVWCGAFGEGGAEAGGVKLQSCGVLCRAVEVPLVVGVAEGTP